LSDDNQELQDYLVNLPDKAHEIFADTIREQAELLSAAQRDALRAQEQSPENSGDLEASCVVVSGKSDLEVIVQAGGDMTTKEVRHGSGTAYDYAVGFEFGTSHQPARPFFYDTYNARKGDIQDALDQAVSEVLNK
jgi:HK97 gp10 family phage protein